MYNQFYRGPFVQPQSPPQYQPPTYQPQPTGIQGKTVDSLDVVRAMDIPLDGSISYFPLVDGSAIVTKQLQQDGTSKTVVFRPADNTEPQVKYVTPDELKDTVNKLDYSKELQELRDELKGLKRKVRFLVDDKKEE